MFAGLKTARGVMRSLPIYYGDRKRAQAMDRLYGEFIWPGDLVFDIGAHVGDRTASFRRLGARVVAVEPQPALARTLRLIYGRDANVRIEQCAIGRVEGETQLLVNADNPTVSTLSRNFVEAARDADGWREQSWARSVAVRVTTLDALIEQHGRPSFIKIDIEGYEAEALATLSPGVECLSFEFTTIQRDVAQQCLARCVALGYIRFNAALGESQRLVHGEWQSAEAIRQWLAALPHAANSGDIYAHLG